MMSAQKKQSSTLREVLITSLQLVLGFIGGVVVCAAWLILKPATIMDGAPGPKRVATDRHEVIYVRGALGLGRQGEKKQKTFLSQTPGEIVFVEQDINRWVSAAYGSKERSFTIPGIGVNLGPRLPSVRLVEDELELGLEVGMDRDGASRVIVAQARGRFVDRGGRQVFVPRKVYFGSCPLPWNLGGRQLYQKLIGLFPVPQNVAAAWDAVGHAAVAENRLRLVIGASAAAAVSAPALPPVVVEPLPPVTETVPASLNVAPEPEPEPAATEAVPVEIDPATSQPAASAPVDPPPASAVPETVPETAPDTTSETAPDTTSEAASETVPESAVPLDAPAAEPAAPVVDAPVP